MLSSPEPEGSASFPSPNEVTSSSEAATLKVPQIGYFDAVVNILKSFRTSPLAILTDIHDRFGDMAYFPVPGSKNCLVVSNPGAIYEILRGTDRGRDDHFNKSNFLVEGAGWIIGADNILTVSDDDWRQQRALVRELFGRSRYDVAAVASNVTACVQKFSEYLESKIEAAGGKVEIDLQHEMSLMALRTTMSSIFGLSDYSNEKLSDIVKHARVVHETFPIETLIPGNVNFKLLSWVSSRAQAIVDSTQIVKEFAQEIIERISSGNASHPTFIDSLLAAEPKIDDTMILHQTIAILFAGHETTGNTMAWTFGAITERPELEAQIAEEARQSALQSDSGLSVMTDCLPIANAVIEESLRLFPPVYLLMRTVTENTTVKTDKGALSLQEGSEIFLNLYSAQRSKTLWGTEKTGFPADEFHHERWLPENRAARGLKPSDMNLFAFGGGPRVCLGMHLFRLEALRAIHDLQTRFKFTPLFDSLQKGVTSDFSLQRKGGFPVEVRLRKE